VTSGNVSRRSLTSEVVRPLGPPPRAGDVLSSLRYGLKFFLDPIRFVGERFERYGDPYFAPSSDGGLYVVRKHEHIRDVLVTHADKFAKTHTALQSLSSVLGSGLLTSDGAVWRKHRRLANPAFGKRAIDSYVPAMVDVAEDAANKFRHGEFVALAPRMIDLTLRVVGRTLLGTDVAEDIDAIGRAMSSFQSFLVVPSKLPSLVRRPIERRLETSVSALDTLVHRILRERRNARVDPPDLMQMLLDASDSEGVETDGALSEQEVRDELVTFLLAGHETTSNTLTWAFDCLARHPAVERRLREELKRVVGNRRITADDLSALTFTTAIVHETMRLYPPAYVVARRAIEEASIGRYVVPRGSEVILWTYFAHRDPEVFSDPDQFAPERFIGSNAFPKCAYIPFGVGPRVCIGRAFAIAEATIALAAIARRWSFQSMTREPPKPVPRITLAPRGGVPVRAFRAP
jgi:cytochrome P450